MAKDKLLVSPSDFLTLAKRSGFQFVNLARILRYSMTASGLDVNFSKRIRYGGDEGFSILFVGPLALPIDKELGITRKKATDPVLGFEYAYELSHGGIDFKYLPPLELDTFNNNGPIAESYYALWLNEQGQVKDGVPNAT